MALISTLAHWNAESYESVSYADAFFSTHPFASLWAALSTAQKELALRKASDILDYSRYFTGPPMRYLYDGPYAQRLHLPGENVDTYGGEADSGTTTTLIDATLADVNSFRNDLFNGGTLRYTTGDLRWQLQRISDFDVSTGTVTVDTAFSGAPAAGDSYTIIYPLPENKRRAVCEMALEVTKGNYDAAANEKALGEGRIPNNLLPAQVLWLLDAQSKATVKLRRT